MNDLYTLFLSGVITLIVNLVTKFVNPKGKLVYWVSHIFQFSVPMDGRPDIQVFTLSLEIKNMGHKVAEGIEIVHRKKPDHYEITPPRKVSEDRKSTRLNSSHRT